MAAVKIHADLRMTTITYDRSTFTVDHDAKQVEELLEVFGRARSGMLPKIPETWVSATVEATRDPKFLVEGDALAADALLHIRDPLFGWRHYIFTKDLARKLGAEMIAWADRPAPNAAGSA